MLYQMDHQTAKEKTKTRFEKIVDGNADIHNANLLVHSDSRDIHWNLAHGESGGRQTTPDQPYHAASVGKTFTSTIIGMLVDTGEISFDDPISLYLPDDLLDGLHVYRGDEYTEDIRIHHLLSHTSGLPHLLSDEFGLINRQKEQSPDGKTFLDIQLEDPDRFWTPEETIEWAKENLQAHFPPGEGIFYSEIGYNLLGLIIDSVTGISYPEALHEYLFDPLGMDQTYLSQYTEPAVASEHPVSNFHWEDAEFEIEQYRSFSGWYAGGQVVSTTEDLLTFHQALVEGELVTEETLDAMTEWQKLSLGLDYGYGLVRFRPLPLLSKYHIWGGIGATSSYMFYCPGIDTYLIGTFNQTSCRSKAFRFLFRVLRTVSKVDAPIKTV